MVLTRGEILMQRLIRSLSEILGSLRYRVILCEYRPVSGCPFSSLFLRQGVGWLGELREVLVGLSERREYFLRPIPPIGSEDLALIEGRPCDERCR